MRHVQIRQWQTPSTAANTQWLYALMVVPVIADLVETGRWPDSARAWITEVAATVVIAALVRRVNQDVRELVRQARVDALTGLWNRRAFAEMLTDEIARVRRTGECLTLVCLDLDGFKDINDTHGHAAGDAALCRLADAMRSVVRTHLDRCFRLGGDEFALLLPASPAGDAHRVLQRILARSSRLRTANEPAVAASAGIVELAEGEDFGALVRRADREMYRQKPGRHRPTAASNESGRADPGNCSGVRRMCASTPD